MVGREKEAQDPVYRIRDIVIRKRGKILAVVDAKFMPLRKDVTEKKKIKC